jgi:hypothetical protein
MTAADGRSYIDGTTNHPVPVDLVRVAASVRYGTVGAVTQARENQQ